MDAQKTKLILTTLKKFSLSSEYKDFGKGFHIIHLN